ncbi:MAG: hypothetical protein DRJ65_14515 [Acidobacteria bacterium]|nr:MAG: hypothetical protein DRJ65_14515 [Acidobacteriota bacterium]
MMQVSDIEKTGPERVAVHAVGSRRLFWSGVGLALVSFLSYFGFTLSQPGSAGLTWVHEVLVVAGAAVAFIGWWRLPPRHITRIGTGMAVTVSALLLGYVHIYSSMLPSTEGVIEVGRQAPDFSLPGPNGKEVRLQAYLGKPLVLIFYRGYW